MKRVYDYNVDYVTAFLSAFDLSGLLISSNLEWGENGFDHDMRQLKNDLNALKDDYLKVDGGILGADQDACTVVWGGERKW